MGLIGTGADDAPDRESRSCPGLVSVWWPPCDMERTTSPLQIGQVRRRVVSHGVLRLLALSSNRIWQGYLHALCMELVPTW